MGLTSSIIAFYPKKNFIEQRLAEKDPCDSHSIMSPPFHTSIEGNTYLEWGPITGITMRTVLFKESFFPKFIKRIPVRIELINSNEIAIIGEGIIARVTRLPKGDIMCHNYKNPSFIEYIYFLSNVNYPKFKLSGNTEYDKIAIIFMEPKEYEHNKIYLHI